MEGRELSVQRWIHDKDICPELSALVSNHVRAERLVWWSPTGSHKHMKAAQ